MYFKKTLKSGIKRSGAFAEDIFTLQEAVILDGEIKLEPFSTLSGWYNKDKVFRETFKDYIKEN